MMLLKTKELTAEQCSLDTQNDLENAQMLTHTHAYAHKNYAYQQILKILGARLPLFVCACVHVLRVHMHLPASMCQCECRYELAFVHIFSWHNAHLNLSLKPVRTDAKLKKKRESIHNSLEIGSNVCSCCLYLSAIFLS